MGKAGLLRLNTLHYAGWSSSAVHSASFAVLVSIVSNGFDVELDSDPTRHNSAKGWLQDKKGIYFGNLLKSYACTNNPDGRGKSGEAIDLGDGTWCISYQGLFCVDWVKEHDWHGQWKRFRAERDEEVLSALNVLVVGAYVFQTNFARISFLSSVMLNGKG